MGSGETVCERNAAAAAAEDNDADAAELLRKADVAARAAAELALLLLGCMTDVSVLLCTARVPSVAMLEGAGDEDEDFELSNDSYRSRRRTSPRRGEHAGHDCYW